MKIESLKSILPQTDRRRREPDVQVVFPLDPKRKPQQVKDHEERKR